MKKTKVIAAWILLVVLLLPSICYAGTWNTLVVAQAPSYIITNSYTSAAFKSDGDIGIDISAYQNTRGNSGTLVLQQQQNDGTWKAYKTYSPFMNVGSYTLYCDGSIQNTHGKYYRIKFTSTYNVRLDGSVQYFTN